MGLVVLLVIYFIPPLLAAILVRRSGIKTEQKRPVGIVVCYIVFILLFIMSLMIAFIAAISGPSQDERIKGPSSLRLLPIFFPIVVSISTIGLWYRQKWGRICSLFVVTVASIFIAYSLYNILFEVTYETVSQGYTFAAVFASIGIIFLSIIYYLTRPKVKEQFK